MLVVIIYGRYSALSDDPFFDIYMYICIYTYIQYAPLKYWPLENDVNIGLGEG